MHKTFNYIILMNYKKNISRISFTSHVKFKRGNGKILLGKSERGSLQPYKNHLVSTVISVARFSIRFSKKTIGPEFITSYFS